MIGSYSGESPFPRVRNYDKNFGYSHIPATNFAYWLIKIHHWWRSLMALGLPPPPPL